MGHSPVRSVSEISVSRGVVRVCVCVCFCCLLSHIRCQRPASIFAILAFVRPHSFAFLFPLLIVRLKVEVDDMSFDSSSPSSLVCLAFPLNPLKWQHLCCLRVRSARFFPSRWVLTQLIRKATIHGQWAQFVIVSCILSSPISSSRVSWLSFVIRPRFLQCKAPFPA